MTLLRIFLFQTLRVTTSEGNPLDLGSPTTRSLFAYLILHRAQPTDRRRLAFYFWPRGTESAARRNLRQYLHRIRRCLEPFDPQGEWLKSDGNSVQFNPKSQIWLDVDQFRHYTRPEASLDELQSGVSLYQGDLLEDLYEDWCQDERQGLRQFYLEALERLSQGMQTEGKLDAAILYTQNWVNAESLDERAHRRLLTLYTLNGDRNRAIQHYQALSEMLAQELDTDPLPETRALFEAIQAGSLLTTSTRSGMGKVQPLLPHLPPAPKPASEKRADIPIVGRQEELARLQEALQSARQGQGGFVLITGESGIGKTRLIQEYLAQNQGIPSLQSVCHELEAMSSFAPLRSTLQQAMEIIPESALQPAPAWLPGVIHLLPGLADRFPLISPWSSAAEEGPHLADAFSDLILSLLTLLDSQPLQIILDDLHWSDGPTCHFLAHLAQHAAYSRLLIIGLCRIEDLPQERLRILRSLERNNLLQQIPLHRLTPEETAALAAQLLPQKELDALFIRRLYQETEGNPFFIIEIVRAMLESGRAANLPLEAGGLRGSPSLPLSIQWVIEARLDHLSTSSQELLATAAAIGRAFTFSLLEEISQNPAEDIIRDIEEWSQRGLVREDAYGYDFTHDKIRQVAYAALSRARRQYIHRRIAGALENSIPAVEAATLAHHYARSDQPLKALPFLTRAGEQALRARSYHEARQFGQQAVSLLGRMPGPRQRSERIDLSLQLAQAYAFSGDLGRAQEILSETEHMALGLGDEKRLGHLFHRSSQIFWLRGQPELAGDYARRTLRAAEELNEPYLLQAALRMLGRVGIALSAFDDAIAYLVRYTNLEAGPSPPADLPIVLGYLGVAYTRVGSWHRALEAAQRGVNLAESAAEDSEMENAASQALAFARMQLAFIYADYHDWQTCLDVLKSIPDPLESDPSSWDMDTSGPTHQLTPLGFMLLGLRGLALAHLGSPQQGTETIQTALKWAERTDYRVFYYLPRMFQADALLLGKQLKSAIAEIEIALEQARKAGNRWATGVGLRLLAEILTRLPAPDWSRIENHLIESMQILRQVRARPDLARTYLALRKLYDRAGQIAWAVDCHFRATSIFEECGMAKELRQAQGQAAHERRGAVVIPGLVLKGPNPVNEE